MFEAKYTNAYAELNITGANLDVTKVSEMLQLKIDCILEPGDYSVQKGGSVIVKLSKKDSIIWTYKTKENETDNLENQLDELISIFGNKINTLVQIKNDFECEMDICMVLYNRQKSLPGISLNKKQIQFLDKIGASIDYDIYQ